MAKTIRIRKGTKKAPVEHVPWHYKPLSFNALKWWWLGCLATMPLDLLLVSFLIERFSDGLTILSSPQIYQIMIWLGAFLLILPVIKELILKLLVTSQGLQHDALVFKSQSTNTFYTFIYLVILGDITFKLYNSHGVIIAIIAVTAGLLAIPFWMKTVIKNKNSSASINLGLDLNSRMERSAKQMDGLLVGIIIANRLALPVILVALEMYATGSTAAYAAFCVALLSMMALKPGMEDIFAMCRKCGLWSRIAYQFDSLCPGCSIRKLKSYQSNRPRVSRFEKIQKGLLEVEKMLRPKR